MEVKQQRKQSVPINGNQVEQPWAAGFAMAHGFHANLEQRLVIPQQTLHAGNQVSFRRFDREHLEQQDHIAVDGAKLFPQAFEGFQKWGKRRVDPNGHYAAPTRTFFAKDRIPSLTTLLERIFFKVASSPSSSSGVR